VHSCSYTKVTQFPLFLLIDALSLNFESQTFGPVGFGGLLEFRLMLALHNVLPVSIPSIFSAANDIDFPKLFYATTRPLHTAQTNIRYLREGNLNLCFSPPYCTYECGTLSLAIRFRIAMRMRINANNFHTQQMRAFMACDKALEPNSNPNTSNLGAGERRAAGGGRRPLCKCLMTVGGRLGGACPVE
jgi:hypothetical protein